MVIHGALQVAASGFPSVKENKIRRSYLRLEHRTQPPLSSAAFLRRVVRYAFGASLIVSLALGIGMVGYHGFEHLSWLDSFLNAAMILGGMGPVNELHSDAGKFFAGCYALFSGLVFLVVAGLLFAPAVHRLLHRFHFDADNLDVDGGSDK